MSDKSRVPVTIPEFNTYIRTGATYLPAGTPANFTRLGLTSANKADWITYNDDWDKLYLKYSDPELSTHIIKENVRHFMSDFRVFANPILNVIAASPAAIDTDAAVFNLVLDSNHKSPTRPVNPIQDTVMAEAKPIGGGDVLATCRTHHDAKHASKHEGADSVQVAYKIDGEPPVDANDNTHKDIFTRAQFIMHLGMINQGKKVYLLMRWYNTKHPDLAGPWGQLITVSLS